MFQKTTAWGNALTKIRRTCGVSSWLVAGDAGDGDGPIAAVVRRAPAATEFPHPPTGDGWQSPVDDRAGGSDREHHGDQHRHAKAVRSDDRADRGPCYSTPRPGNSYRIADDIVKWSGGTEERQLASAAATANRRKKDRQTDKHE